MMQAWGDWMGRVGPALADGGALKGDHAVSAARFSLPVTGYNIVDADCPEAAKALCDGHPSSPAHRLTSPSTCTS